MGIIRFSDIAAGPVLLTVLAAWSAPAGASDREDPPDDGYYAYADVVDVSPRYGWHEITEPVMQCVDVVDEHGHARAGYERQRYRSRYDRHDHHDPHDRYERYQEHDGRTAAGLVGGIIGGLIGNQFGGGDGRKALTIAGALLGASIARDRVRDDAREHDYRYRSTDIRTQGTRHCTETERTRTVRGVNGYDVTYRYQGTVFHKWMDTHPGDAVRVHVAVQPLATE